MDIRTLLLFTLVGTLRADDAQALSCDADDPDQESCSMLLQTGTAFMGRLEEDSLESASEAESALSSSDLGEGCKLVSQSLERTWTTHELKYLPGYAGSGETCFDEAAAKAQCLRDKTCHGINKQYNQCGGTKWTLRAGTTPTTSRHIHGAGQLVSQSLETTWTRHDLKYLSGLAASGESCFDEATAKAKCVRDETCNGINKQDNQCGGAKWTLRAGTTPMTSAHCR